MKSDEIFRVAESKTLSNTSSFTWLFKTFANFHHTYHCIKLTNKITIEWDAQLIILFERSTNIFLLRVVWLIHFNQYKCITC